LDEVLEESFRREWPVLVGAVTRMVGDLHAAEEIVQDVLVTALARWPFSGVPERPGAWLLTAARNRARNHLRDAARAGARLQASASMMPAAATEQPEEPLDGPMADDRLRLVFLCCHPVLPMDAQAALTLRMVSGLSTRQVARAFLQPEATVAQRIVRAKRTLAEADVRFAVPDPQDLPQRLPGVLKVVYLVFNEGHSAAEGPDLTRSGVCDEALRLGHLLDELLPGDGEILGLVALMEYQAARLCTRTDAGGNLVLLPDQDRSRWDRARIAAGDEALRRAYATGAAGPMTLQAAIAACHATAPSWDETDWPLIVELYDALGSAAPSPVVSLNRAVALAMAGGPEDGLAAVDQLVESQALDRYHLLWATRADLLRRLGRPAEAVADYERALALATNDAEYRFLAARRSECTVAGTEPIHVAERGEQPCPAPATP
jgi:RNA polymerase sigma factor (sigma-70 family)